MERVLILGRGGAGKSRAAIRLGESTGLPVIELDQYFWPPHLVPMAADEWSRVQAGLAARDRWIMDGDLGPHDSPGARLAAADTVLILDFSLVRCAWRAIRRGRERADFWRWVLSWRWHSRPSLLRAVADFAPDADVHILRTPRALDAFLATAYP